MSNPSAPKNFKKQLRRTLRIGQDLTYCPKIKPILHLVLGLKQLHVPEIAPDRIENEKPRPDCRVRAGSHRYAARPGRRLVTPVLFWSVGVAGGIAIAGRVVSRVAQVHDVRFVNTEGIGGGRTLGNGSVGVAVVVVLRFLRRDSTSEDESGRCGQNKKSHDMILVSCFESWECTAPDDYATRYKKFSPADKLSISGS
jgi:hypothetical protein